MSAVFSQAFIKAASSVNSDEAAFIPGILSSQQSPFVSPSLTLFTLASQHGGNSRITILTLPDCIVPVSSCRMSKSHFADLMEFSVYSYRTGFQMLSG